MAHGQMCQLHKEQPTNKGHHMTSPDTNSEEARDSFNETNDSASELAASILGGLRYLNLTRTQLKTRNEARNHAAGLKLLVTAAVRFDLLTPAQARRKYGIWLDPVQPKDIT